MRCIWSSVPDLAFSKFLTSNWFIKICNTSNHRFRLFETFFKKISSKSSLFPVLPLYILFAYQLLKHRHISMTNHIRKKTKFFSTGIFTVITGYYNHNYNCRVVAHTAGNPDYNSFSYIRFQDCCSDIQYGQYEYCRHSFHARTGYCSGNYFPAGS